MFNEAKEFSASVSYGSGINAQVAYSFSNHIAFMANGNLVVNKMDFTESQRPAKPHHLFGEGGIGYFRGGKKYRFEVFGGYGVGEGYGREPRWLFILEGAGVVGKGTYERLFLQPSFSLGMEHTMIIFTTRLSGVNFRSYRAIDGEGNRPANGYNLFFEPAITWRINPSKNFNPFVQIGVNTAVKSVNYHSNVFQVAVGIQFNSGPSRKDGD